MSFHHTEHSLNGLISHEKTFIHFWDTYYTKPRAPSADIVSENFTSVWGHFHLCEITKNVINKTTRQKLFSWVTTLYPRMLPFCSCSGTGPQVTRMRLELMASTVTFSGAPDGTTQTEKDKSHSLIAQCLNTWPRVLSKLTGISHLSNVIREKRKQTALAWAANNSTGVRRQWTDH